LHNAGWINARLQFYLDIRVTGRMLEEQPDDVRPVQLHSLCEGGVARDVTRCLVINWSIKCSDYVFVTLMLGLTPASLRASSTVIMLPCFTATLEREQSKSYK
jgi:hypothetical protein